MALGVPVVSTKIGGIPELIIEGKTGLLVKPNDINELSFKITEILSRKQNVYREDCIKQAERFDITNVGEKITDLYLDLNRK